MFPPLSERMGLIVTMAESVEVIADVGCDHGYLGIASLLTKRANKIIACDINQGPLDSAKRNAEVFGVSGSMEFRLADGFAGLTPGEADEIILAGIGGGLMIDILKKGEAVAKAAGCMILSPQSDIPDVRRFLLDEGYAILDEHMLREDGKFYTVMTVAPIEDIEYPGDELGIKYGGILIEAEDEVLKEFLSWREEILIGIMEKLPEGSSRIKETEDELAEIKSVLSLMGE